MNIAPLISPRSVAVIGASATPGKIGNDIVHNLVRMGYAGKIYPINPKCSSLFGLTCYPSLSALPETPDLMVFALPASLVNPILEEGGKRGVPAAIVLSAGFREIGTEGAAREEELIAIAKTYNIALLGPNCLGIIHPALKLNASFASVMPKAGSVAFISQSGALCTSVLDYAQAMGMGFSKFISIGNKALIDEIELIEYLTHDRDTKVIMMYEEDLARGGKFIEVVRKLTLGADATPVISLKAGRTSVGAAASASHTGALGGDDAVIDAIFRKSGVIRAYSIEQLFDYATAFAHNPLPEGNRIGIITNAGGPGVLAADACVAQGLAVPPLPDSSQSVLAEHLPKEASTHNPVDVLGDARADRYEAALEAVLTSSHIDGCIVIITPQTTTEIKKTAEAIIHARNTHEKPVIGCFMGADSVREGVQLLQEKGVATAQFPEDAASALGALSHFSLRLKEPYSKRLSYPKKQIENARTIIESASKRNQAFLSETDTRKLLEAYGFHMLPSQILKSQSDAKAVMHVFQTPVALRIISPEIIHKSDVGGVMLNVRPSDIPASYEEMRAIVRHKVPDAQIEGVMATEMAPTTGFELILGAKRDYRLGVGVVMVGTGGIFVEVYKDISFTATPVTRYGAEAVISRTKIEPILKGVRGRKPLDRSALISAIGQISELIEDHTEIAELDINPFLLLPEGAVVIDARVRIKQ